MKYLITILFVLTSFVLTAQVKYVLSCDSALLDLSREILIKQIGVRELTGNNDGKQIELYLISVGLNPKGKYPYCEAGQYYCFKVAADSLGLPASDIPIAKTGLANGMFNDVKRKGKQAPYKAEVDALLVWKNVRSASGHVERITKLLFGGWVDLVGFNTSNGKRGSQNNGNGVFPRRRNINHPLSKLLAVRGLISFKKTVKQRICQ